MTLRSDIVQIQELNQTLDERMQLRAQKVGALRAREQRSQGQRTSCHIIICHVMMSCHVTNLCFKRGITSFHVSSSEAHDLEGQIDEKCKVHCALRGFAWRCLGVSYRFISYLVCFNFGHWIYLKFLEGMSCKLHQSFESKPLDGGTDASLLWSLCCSRGVSLCKSFQTCFGCILDFWQVWNKQWVWAFNTVRLRVDLPGKGYGRKYGEPRRKAQERVRASGCLAEKQTMSERWTWKVSVFSAFRQAWKSPKKLYWSSLSDPSFCVFSGRLQRLQWAHASCIVVITPNQRCQEHW